MADILPWLVSRGEVVVLLLPSAVQCPPPPPHSLSCRGAESEVKGQRKYPTLPVWCTHCQYGALPVWCTHCQYGALTASMVHSLPVWCTHCQYGALTASVVQTIVFNGVCCCMSIECTLVTFHNSIFLKCFLKCSSYIHCSCF